ncbi:MAG: hypothetical protein IJX17_00675 [Clostridia bacterium]|nr:hypothetical protein [Clostridia bacterium]
MDSVHKIETNSFTGVGRTHKNNSGQGLRTLAGLDSVHTIETNSLTGVGRSHKNNSGQGL